MRFLLGLIAGATVTIWLANTTNGLTPAVGDDLQRMWSNLIRETADLDLGVELIANAAETDVPAAATGEMPAESNAETTTISTQLDQDPSPQPLQRSVATESAPSPAEAPIPIDRIAMENEPLTPTDDAILVIPPTPAGTAAPAGTATPTGTAPIWEPFHSEISARGFAKRLSLQLGYPFAVTKQGPARYLVVFDYQSAAERTLLEQQIAVLTGYRHP